LGRFIFYLSSLNKVRADQRLAWIGAANQRSAVDGCQSNNILKGLEQC
jgi:hypothetical protein